MAQIDEELGIKTPNANVDASIVNEVEDGGKDVLKKVQETYDLVKPEAETLVKNVLDSGKRLDAKPRVVGSVPNSLLVYGGIALVLFLVFRK
jgi:hypothetical protein